MPHAKWPFHISSGGNTMQIDCGYTIPITLFGILPSSADHLKGMEIVGQAGFKLPQYG